MDMKKIKNYIVLAIVVMAAFVSLWNGLTGDSDNTPDTVDKEIITSVDAEEKSNQQDEEAIESETIDEDLDVQTEDETSIDLHEATYNEALSYIDGYNDIIDAVWLDSLSEHVIESYSQYDADGWNGLVDGQAPGTKAGGKWGNYDDQLPEYDGNGNEITYKEFDVNDKIEGSSRDAERFVVGSDTFVYYTEDHYDTFVLVLE